MAYNAELYGYSSRRRDESDFNLREWTVKARISRENNNNINSRRYSDEIDPSTYSFTTALKGNHIVN
ncbi:hypothetical protein TSUD_169350 [Trifolium subterraneum]|nr:hypothetical protein TSUD_169350 [Trifolium subterraneum]